MDVGTLVGVTGYIWMLTNPMRAAFQYHQYDWRRPSPRAEKLLYYMDFGSRIQDEKPDAISRSQVRRRVWNSTM